MYNEIEEIGKRVSLLRKDCGMTQEQLAEKLNMSLNHVAKMEIGLRRFTLETLIDLSRLFDVSLDYLILGKPHSTAAAMERLENAISELAALKQML